MGKRCVESSYILYMIILCLPGPLYQGVERLLLAVHETEKRLVLDEQVSV